MTEIALEMLALTEAQSVALLELLPRIRRDSGLFKGIYLWMRSDAPGVLVIGSDGWPDVWKIDPDGEVEEPPE